MIRFGVIATLFAAMTVGGCATVTRGSTNKVQFVSEPAGALMTTSTGMNCVTPCTLEVPRKDGFIATFKLAGYETQTINVTTVVQGSGAAGVVGNVLVGGIVGVGVDVVTGAANDHSPNPVSVVFRRSAATPRR
jgi:hypothetical protein